MRASGRKGFVLITGATGGLGRKLSQAFWLKGYNLVLTSRDLAAVRSLAKQLGPRSGQQIIPVAGDLKNPEAPKMVLDACRSENASIEVLVNNAAIQGPIATLESSDAARWAETIMVDLLAPVALCRLLLPLMKERGYGRIINFSGGGATGPRPLFSAYAAAKTALVRFTETLAVEISSSGITVNAVSPGVMKTGLMDEIMALGPSGAGQKEYDNAEKALNLQSDSFAAAVKLCLFLASSRASGITGRLISAVWDDYEDWPKHIEELRDSDLYTLRRITGHDRNTGWGDK